jgi:hypothetical protein
VPTRDIWALDLSDWSPSVDLGKAPNVIVLVVRWAPLVFMCAHAAHAAPPVAAPAAPHP